MEQRYQVRFSGKTDEHVDGRQAVSKLARALKQDEQFPEQLLSGKTYVVKSTADLQAANDTSEALRKHGLITQVVDVDEGISSGQRNEAGELQSTPALSPCHDTDTISVETESRYVSLDFLNVGTKAHALKRLEATLPEQREFTEVQRSRIRSGAPRFTILAIMAAIGLRANDGLIWFVLGAIALMFVVPTFIRRIADPTVTVEYKFQPAPAFTETEPMKKAA